MTTNFTFTNISQHTSVTISILEDTFFEDSEVFKVEISLVGMKDGGCVILQPSFVDINILDNDGELVFLSEITLNVTQLTVPDVIVIGFSVAVIGFSCDNYMVTEGVDNSANLTVELISGQLGWEVVVKFGTSYPSGSAISMLIT